MKRKYKVSADNIEYLLREEVEANSADEAVDIYLKMWDEGMVLVNKSELTNVKVTEIVE